ncbi:hypothetical protein BN2475_630039 [Paraburkholderia ribeironis]|uniref:Uncharacterized protein n=1 Tax=Paraburkholderia ribeironis TaxID=1247936 RepID=A0A1N7SFK5_9BURK|nr:hypothetical protein BN2475_630039 [Paraburkholderia ribeironis]
MGICINAERQAGALLVAMKDDGSRQESDIEMSQRTKLRRTMLLWRSHDRCRMPGQKAGLRERELEGHSAVHPQSNPKKRRSRDDTGF